MLLLPMLAAAMTIPEARVTASLGELIRGVGDGNFIVELFADPKGVIEGCGVDYSQLPKSQSDKLCNNAIGLKLAKPAIGSDGQPAYGVFLLTRVRAGSPPKLELPADLELSVTELPKKYHNSLRVGLTVMVDSQGSEVACESDKDAPADYAQVACAQMGMQKLRIRQNTAGMAVPYVAGMIAQFSAEER
jgi:hypothetical protein